MRRPARFFNEPRLRARYLVDAVGYNRVSGQPFKAGEVAAAVEAIL